jgi:hypothetical protein
VILVAQSLGCHVISNYIWDAQHAGSVVAGIWKAPEDDLTSMEQSDFRKLKTLKRLYITGCNIPIFVAGHRPILPIRVTEDIPINAGGNVLSTLLASWNPLSHLQYWKDAEVINHIVDSIKLFIRITPLSVRSPSVLSAFFAPLRFYM